MNKYIGLIIFLTFFSCKEIKQNEKHLDCFGFTNEDWIKVDSNYAKLLMTDYDSLDVGYLPENGFVPDEFTALKIAELVLLPIYGENIYDKKPYTIELKDGIWIVEGSLPEKMFGGAPYVEIRKKDGKIMKVYHGE